MSSPATTRNAGAIAAGERFIPLPIAAATPAELDVAAANAAERMAADRHLTVVDVARNLVAKQTTLPHRRVVFARNRDEALRALRSRPGPSMVTGERLPQPPSLGFLFPGPSREHSLLELYVREPVFRRAFDECESGCRAVGTGRDIDLRAMLEQMPVMETPGAMCFLFAVEFSLFQLWAAWGVRPALLMGYSFGELVAAACSQVFSLPDVFTLVLERDRLLNMADPGAMTSVALSEEAVQPLLGSELRIAIHRSPKSCVVSGPPLAVAALEGRLKRDEVPFQRLDIPLAGHSKAADKLAPAFAEKVAAVSRFAPRLPIVSNVSGARMTAEEAANPQYWAAQLARTVQFARGLRTMVQEGCRVLLEIGPGHHLTSLASQQVRQAEGVYVVPSIRTLLGDPSVHLGMLRSLARLWTLGVEVDWPACYAAGEG